MMESDMEGFYLSGGKALFKVMKDLKNFNLQLAKEDWANLTLQEKANIRRFVTEASMVILLGLSGALLGKEGKIIEEDFDGDDMGDRAILGSFTLLNYQVNRLYTEVSAYANPGEFVKLMRTPMASISIVENMLAVLNQVTDPFEVYKAGWKKDENKLLWKASKLVPGYKQLLTLNTDGIKDRTEYFSNNY